MASVSYPFKTGYYGLRVHETLEQVLSGEAGKPMRIPMPDRKAKMEAMSMTRAYLEDSAKKYNAHERALLDYRDAGGNLPEAAAGDGPSPAGQDETFARIERHHEAMQEQSAFEEAENSLKQQDEQQTKEARAQHLSAKYAPNRMDPMIEAHHEELEEAGVGHYMPEVVTAPDLEGAAAAVCLCRSPPGPAVPQLRSFEPGEVPRATGAPADRGPEHDLRARAGFGRAPKLVQLIRRATKCFDIGNHVYFGQSHCPGGRGASGGGPQL